MNPQIELALLDRYLELLQRNRAVYRAQWFLVFHLKHRRHELGKLRPAPRYYGFERFPLLIRHGGLPHWIESTQASTESKLVEVYIGWLVDSAPTAPLLPVLKRRLQELDRSVERVCIVHETKLLRFPYAFELCRRDDGWRCYIQSYPPYGLFHPRSEGPLDTHRLFDRSRDRFYICFSGAIRTAKEAHAVAIAFAEHTDAYIRYGTRF